MSTATLVSNINTINNNLSQQRKRLYESQKKKANKNAEILRINSSITKNTTPSMLKLKLNQINRCQQEVVKCEANEASLMKKIADEENRLVKKQAELQRARNEEQKKTEKTQLQAILQQ